ncbi:MAG TPA: bifunctional GNAT family N-acetyltransferase/class I SAM-dependent methyltransferase [Microthrixaceae bacterium]|nr:bifunctional GNAT family N-acetyltransferase/class I SAM-dependent methyltransferase [Microthrixaceae bacterium]
MNIPIRVETDRLILRDLTLDDVDDRYCSWLRDEEVTQFLEARFDDNSPESLQRYVRSQLADGSTVFAAIVEKPDLVIGTIKLGPIDPHHRRADIGIMLGERSAWGRRYATEAIEALSVFAFEQLGVIRLSAGAYSVNQGSIKAFTRAGFSVEGRLKGGAQVGAERVDLVLMGRLAPGMPATSDLELGGTGSPGSPGRGELVPPEQSHQRDVFLSGEGDRWFERNPIDEVRADGRDRLVASFVLASSSVLEIGCADGRRLAAVSSLAPARRFVGIDPSAAAVEAGRIRFPNLELMIGTAEDLPFVEQFDLVVVGFCFYLCDRALLPRIVSEIDRVLRDGGTLVIIDFDPDLPSCRPYRHRRGLWSYKMDYAALFLAHPSYSLKRKDLLEEDGSDSPVGASARVAMNVLRKCLPGAYAAESDG